MDIKLMIACFCMMVGYVRLAPTTTSSTPPVYPWQKPIACDGCQPGSGGVPTMSPSERANDYFVISSMANNVKNNLTNVINDQYLEKGLLSSVDKEELDQYTYPALAEFPNLPSLPTNDISISLPRAYKDIQTVASFVEQVRVEHGLQAHDPTSVDMENQIKVSLQTTGLNKLSRNVCCSVTSHGATHPDDVTMDDANKYTYPHSHSYAERYRRDYLILRDSASVMEYIHNEFKRYHEALV